MDLFEAIILGCIQGLTEFLPISSTAHLRIVPALFGWKDPGAPFTAVTQIGTLIAVLFYFRIELRKYALAFFTSLRTRQGFDSGDSRIALSILLGTIPIVILGFLFKGFIETSFRSIYVISFSLVGLAILLGLAEFFSKRKYSLDTLSLPTTQLIGLAQAIALIPGASRSGTTITAGLFLNMTREAAAKYSFLLSIPAVALSGVYQLYKLRDSLVTEAGFSLLLATVIAGLVGYASIGFLIRYLHSHSTYLFIFYRVLLGILLFILIQINVIIP